jgi:hypothetical protein
MCSILGRGLSCCSCLARRHVHAGPIITPRWDMGLNCTPLNLFFFFILIRFGSSSKFLNWWKGKGSCICICAAAITCTGLLYLPAFQTYYKSEFAQIPNQQKISSPRHILETKWMLLSFDTLQPSQDFIMYSYRPHGCMCIYPTPSKKRNHYELQLFSCTIPTYLAISLSSTWFDPCHLPKQPRLGGSNYSKNKSKKTKRPNQLNRFQLLKGQSWMEWPTWQQTWVISFLSANRHEICFLTTDMIRVANRSWQQAWLFILGKITLQYMI